MLRQGAEDVTDVARQPFRNLGILSVFLTLVTLGTKVLGFVREVLVSAWFGASHQTDAFYLVFSLLFVAMGAAASQLPRVFVPEYQRRELLDQEGKGTSASAAYMGSNLVFFLPLALAAAGALFCWPDEFISLVAPRLPEATHKQSVELVRIMLPLAPCLALVAVVTSVEVMTGASFAALTVTFTVMVSVRSPSETRTTKLSLPWKSAAGV